MFSQHQDEVNKLLSSVGVSAPSVGRPNTASSIRSGMEVVTRLASRGGDGTVLDGAVPSRKRVSAGSSRRAARATVPVVVSDDPLDGGQAGLESQWPQVASPVSPTTTHPTSEDRPTAVPSTSPARAGTTHDARDTRRHTRQQERAAAVSGKSNTAAARSLALIPSVRSQSLGLKFKDFSPVSVALGTPPFLPFSSCCFVSACRLTCSGVNDGLSVRTVGRP